MHARRRGLLRSFKQSLDDADPSDDDLLEEKKSEEEKLLAEFCLQSSRLYIQVTQFLDESNYFKGSKFIYEGRDLLKVLRGNIRRLRREQSGRFENPIPLMDRYGRLLFDQAEIDAILTPRGRPQAGTQMLLSDPEKTDDEKLYDSANEAHAIVDASILDTLLTSRTAQEVQAVDFSTIEQ